MPIQNDSLNKSLYGLLKTQGFNPIPKDSTGKTTPVPDEADVFKFTFKDNELNEDGETTEQPAWATIENGQLKVYYDDSNMDSGGKFTKFLQHLKRWSQGRQLGFDLENEDHLSSDMAQREHMKKQEQISEGYYPMGKSSSYSDSIPTVKIVLQHTRQIQEGEQRFRNIARIYLENTQGERILAPTTRPGIAQVYARHLAEGGVPNDERWNHIKSLCEEYSKMAGFVRAVRNNQFNESAQRLVEAGLNHYTSLRESLGKMRGHRGYNAYFESWTPTLMENDGDETNLNELFVQETLDPRIESVMPILNRLKVNLGEMKEVDELAEWADKVLEDESLTSNNPQGVPEDEAVEEGIGDALKSVGKKVAKAFTGPDDEELLRDLAKKAGIPQHAQHGKPRMAVPNKEVNEEEVEESGLQAYLGNKKYGKEGMDALRQAGREHAGKEKIASIRAKYDKLDEQGTQEDLDSHQKRAGQVGPTEKAKTIKGHIGQPNQPHPFQGRLVGASESVESTEKSITEMDKSQPSSDRGGESSGDPYAKGGKATPITAKKAKKDFAKMFQKNIDKSNKDKKDTDEKVKQHQDVKEDESIEEGLDDFVKGIKRKIAGKPDPKDVEQFYLSKARRSVQDANKLHNQSAYDDQKKQIDRYNKVSKVVNKEEGVAEGQEDLDRIKKLLGK